MRYVFREENKTGMYSNTEGCSSNHGRRGKSVSITYSDCVFAAFFIQHIKRICLILSPVACPALQHFSTIFHIGSIFGEKVIEHTKRVLVFSTT
jgi:hypothetical protein